MREFVRVICGMRAGSLSDITYFCPWRVFHCFIFERVGGASSDLVLYIPAATHASNGRQFLIPGLNLSCFTL
jgi:hypothetical protein